MILIASASLFCLCGGLGNQVGQNDLAGEWLLASGSYYDDEGTLSDVCNDAVESPLGTLVVTINDDCTFTAETAGQTVTGAVEDGEIATHFTLSERNFTVLGRLFDTSTLYLAVAAAGAEGPTAAELTYTRDGGLPTFRDYYQSLTGSWSTDTVWNTDGITSGPLAAVITKQTSGIFYGSVTTSDGTSVLCGALSMLECAPLRSGLAIDGNGNTWAVMIKNNQFIFADPVSGREAELTEFPDVTQVYVQQDLTGYSWSGTETSMTVTWTHGQSFSGTVTIGDDTGVLYGCICPAAEGLALMTVTAADGTVAWGIFTFGSSATDSCYLFLFNDNGTATTAISLTEAAV
ncbi:MAG: hypothetical protein WC132_06190 [Methanomethylophilus sp.]